MNPYEEALQKQMEAGQMPEGDELDVRAYREVFRVLKKEPGFELSPNFADRVVGRVMEKRARDLSKEYFWFGTGIFFLAISFLTTVYFTGFRPDLGFLKSMVDYKGLVVFGVLFIGLLNWVDKRLIRGSS